MQIVSNQRLLDPGYQQRLAESGFKNTSISTLKMGETDCFCVASVGPCPCSVTYAVSDDHGDKIIRNIHSGQATRVERSGISDIVLEVIRVFNHDVMRCNFS